MQMATMCPTAPQMSCSMASPCRRKTITTSPTACVGAGRLALRPLRSVVSGRNRHRPARPPESACRSAAASGAIIRSSKVFEALSHGTTNPWGHDWDEHGELFFVNTVNGHLWHMIPGAHFTRSHTIDPNPYVYELIDQHADHWHFDTGKGWTASRDGAANGLGGGHAHGAR